MLPAIATALAGIVVLAAAPAFAAPPLAPPVQEHVLPNGLHLVLAPDDALEDVSVIVRYGVGSADDPEGKDGLAHVVEHLMFDGSRHVGSGEHARRIAQAGGWDLNAITFLDRTEYVVTVPPGQLPLVFWLESDRMGFLAERVDQTALDRERELVRYEASDRVFDRALGTVGATALQEIFPPWHPYHRNPDPRWVPSITLADVRAFVRTWYGPANATLVVAGRFDAPQTLALAERYFGGLRGSPPPVRPALPAAWDVHDVLVQMQANVWRAQVTFMWPTPALEQPGDAELDVAALLLADRRGRLQAELVDRGLAVSVHAGQASYRRASAFYVTAAVADKQSLTGVADVIDRVVKAMAREVRVEDCARAREELAESRLMRMETSMGRARHLSATTSLTSPWELSRYERIQPEDVRRVVATALVPNRRAVVLAYADPRGPISGRVFSRKEWLP